MQIVKIVPSLALRVGMSAGGYGPLRREAQVTTMRLQMMHAIEAS